PVDTKAARKRYARFRKSLVNDGFLMLQFSVYGRPCPSEENALVHSGRVKKAIPSEGQVRILRLTDMQFSRMEVFYGKTAVDPGRRRSASRGRSASCGCPTCTSQRWGSPPDTRRSPRKLGPSCLYQIGVCPLASTVAQQ